MNDLIELEREAASMNVNCVLCTGQGGGECAHARRHLYLRVCLFIIAIHVPKKNQNTILI